MNTWPKGYRYGMYQNEHEKWNSQNYPGTLQICIKCEEPTGRCEEDSLEIEDAFGEVGSYCEKCYDEEARA